MKPAAIALAAVGLSLLTFFQFPGHTWLQQDTQIYVPILEHLHDPSLFRNEILAQQPHVAFTLYDEIARALRAITGRSFHDVLLAEQIVARALGIWGLFLIATALGLSDYLALAVASICSLGAVIAGPTVLTIEYEPTPRAFAIPLLMCAMGLAAQRRNFGAGVAAGFAFLYHPPTSIAFWAVFLIVLVRRRQLWDLVPLLVTAAVIAIAAPEQAGGGEGQTLLARLTPIQEQLQRMRASYVWISLWPWKQIFQYLILAGALAAAYWRVHKDVHADFRIVLLGLPALGLISMPVSWLLLEHFKWALIPQVQPLRMVLFVTLSMEILTAVAGVYAARRGRVWEAAIWFSMAYMPAVHPVVLDSWPMRHALVVFGLGVATALACAFATGVVPLAVALAAFFAVPVLGGIVNYPHLHTPELAQLSEWARNSTPRDAVFHFPEARRQLDPGIFRSEALRAVYVDWKGGGQVNYLKDFAEQWWFRWQIMQSRFKPGDLPKYEGLGIRYVVLPAKSRLPRAAVFENSRYVVYSVPSRSAARLHPAGRSPRFKIFITLYPTAASTS